MDKRPPPHEPPRDCGKNGLLSPTLSSRGGEGEDKRVLGFKARTRSANSLPAVVELGTAAGQPQIFPLPFRRGEGQGEGSVSELRPTRPSQSSVKSIELRSPNERSS